MGDLDLLDWILGIDWDNILDEMIVDAAVSSIITNCSSIISDSESCKRKGVKRNASEDIAPTSKPSKSLSVEKFMLKVRTLQNKATALRGQHKLIQIPENRLLEMDHLLTVNSDEASTSGETSQGTPINVAETIHLDQLKEESLFKCNESQSPTSQSKRTKKILEGDELEEVSPSMSIEPQSLASLPKRSEEILEDEGNTVNIDHRAKEMTSEEAIQHKVHTVAEKRVVKEVEGSQVEDIGYTTSTASQPSSFQTMTSLPQQEVEEETMVLNTSAQKLMLEDVLQIRIVGVQKDDTTIHFASKTCIEETSEREKQSKYDNSDQRICEHFGRRLDDAAKGFSWDELENNSLNKCIKPQSLTSQPNRSEEISKEIGNTAEIDHSTLEITFEMATNHKEQTDVAQTVDELIDESPVEDVVYATNNEDVKYAMTIASEPSSFQTMTSVPGDQVEEDMMMLEDEGDASQQLPCISQPLFRNGTEEDEQVLDITESTPNINPYEEIAKDETSMRQPDNVADIICLDELEEESSIQCTEPRSLTPESRRTEKILEDDGNIVEMDHSAPGMILKEAIQHSGHTVADQGEAYTSKQEKAYEKDFSYESLSQHFGRPLDDARNSFGVSRTAFKKMCRDVGIKRWKYGKRNMGHNSSNHRRLNDEVLSRRNFSSRMPPVQDTPVVSHTSQDLKKMTVKATYNGVPIRFNLPDLAGLSELEDNVIKRLHLERDSFTIKYQDDEGEWVLIACDEDVRECVEFSRSLKKTTIKMLLDQPVDHYAPEKQME